MDRRVFVLFCLLTAVRSDDAQKVQITVENKIMKCEGGTYDDGSRIIDISEGSSKSLTCSSNECSDNSCPKALVKILGSENLIQLNMGYVVTVLISNILVTILIGWAVYSVCAQPTTRGGYQGNKASDRQALINNHNPSGADTYQRLNTRADEYSTLHAPRKQKNKQSV